MAAMDAIEVADRERPLAAGVGRDLLPVEDVQAHDLDRLSSLGRIDAPLLFIQSAVQTDTSPKRERGSPYQPRSRFGLVWTASLTLRAGMATSQPVPILNEGSISC